MRYLILAVVHAVLFSSLAFAAPTVFLKDGTTATGNAVWTENGKVYLSDSKEIREFGQDEVRLDETMKYNKIGTQMATPDAPASAPATSGKAQRAKRRHASLSAVRADKPATETAAQPAAVTPPVTQPVAKPATASAPAAATVNVVKPLPKSDAPSAPAAAPPAPAPKVTVKEPVPPAAPAIPPAVQMMSSGFPVMFLLIILAVSLLIVAAYWIIYERAGQAGWKSLIPFYNMYVLMEISGKPGWWMFLLFVPLVGVVVYLLAMLSLAKRFGRSELFGVGIFLLPMVFLPLLAFGGAKYEG
jgi:hypothetical protein